MNYPASIRLPRDLFDRLSLGTHRSDHLEPEDILIALSRPSEFTRADVEFCRANAWSCLEYGSRLYVSEPA